MSVFALVDGNNFYVSCERVFNPRLDGRPVVVLSNNDGCVVSRSDEAKSAGIKMGAPWFQMRHLARKHGIVALSSNYELYANLSNRMMGILSRYSPNQEIYSIDECFLGLDGFQNHNLDNYGQEIRRTVRQWIGIPVCVGIGASKTLAKLANHCAKKRLAGKEGVCNLDGLAPGERSALFSRIPAGEIWGVGPRLSRRLVERGMATVEALRTADAKVLRREFSVTLERTIAELNGVSCLNLDETVSARQQIISSRSFGQYVYELEPLGEAVASYIAIAAQKLRSQNSLAGMLRIYIRTNPHNEHSRQYQQALTIPLPEPTCDTLRLTRVARWGLKRIYRPGFAYQKASVALMNLQDAGAVQSDLFSGRKDNTRLMQVMDRINAAWGRGTLHCAAEGLQKNWAMKSGKRSPAYTTRWDQLPEAS